MADFSTDPAEVGAVYGAHALTAELLVPEGTAATGSPSEGIKKLRSTITNFRRVVSDALKGDDPVSRESMNTVRDELSQIHQLFTTEEHDHSALNDQAADAYEPYVVSDTVFGP